MSLQFEHISTRWRPWHRVFQFRYQLDMRMGQVCSGLDTAKKQNMLFPSSSGRGQYSGRNDKTVDTAKRQ